MPGGGHEFALIDWIRRRSRSSSNVPLGIGDDAALVDLAPDGRCLVTTDMLMDGVDFMLASTPAELIGRKALAVNLSDIAAMAGRPVAAFVSLALPRANGRALAEGLYAGLGGLADEYGVVIAGGDTNSWDGPLVINVAVLGAPTGPGAVTRGGAQPGDWIMATGALGGSLSGRHLTFAPRVREALALHQTADLHAMIDLSDGLASDLPHILQESGVGALVRAAAIPVHDDVDPSLDASARLRHALSDGEDFELLFTVPPGDGLRLLEERPFDTPLSHIGDIIADRSCLLESHDGRREPLPGGGWEHTFTS